MNNLPLVSIIVPVFKVETFIEKCINSIITQSYDNLEIILVDDGSPDNCPIICDDFAKKDSRIIVIHQENMGLPKARESGFLKSTGDYIYFVDSDDFIHKDNIKILVDHALANNVDITIAGIYFVEGNLLNSKPRLKPGIYKSKDIRMACRRLNIKIIYCSPDHPEGKGKQERFYGIAEQIYKQFEARKNIPLKVFCVLVEEWIKIYNDRPLPHRGNKSPNQLFDEDISRKLIPLPIEYINSAFVKTEYRKIHKDGTVSVNGIIFQIPVQYAKMYKKVLIRFSTYDNYDASLALDSGELVPLKEQVIDEDIDWSAKSAIKERNDLPEEPDTIYLEYVARSRAKRLGTYKDEESFQKEYKAMFNTPSSFEGQSDAQDKSKTKKASQPSPYSIADEKGDNK